MLFYILFLVVTLSIVFVLNSVCKVDTVTQCLLYTFIGFLFEFVLDAIVALCIRRLVPEKWIHPGKGMLKVHKFEKRFYERIGIKRWKDKVPELGKATNFHKDHIENSDDSEYLKRFILESSYGELIHTFSCLLGFTILFLGFIKPHFTLSIFLPCAFINLFLNILPTFIQRYVRPRLELLLKRSERLRKVDKNE